MSKIFCIYPTDRQQSTKFLNRINTYLKRELESSWYCYKLKFTDEDHMRCLTKANKSDAKLILFMGHGNTNTLYGSCNVQGNEFVSEEASCENEQFYKNENFINSSNIGIFKEKIIFSFSCFSNREDKNSIGVNAISQGVKCFIGFGDIPTDFVEGNGFSTLAIAKYKGIIVKVIKQSIFLSIKNNHSVKELIDLIKILTNKEIQFLIFSKEKFRHKNIVIQKLFEFKSEIKVFGDYYQKLY